MMAADDEHRNEIESIRDSMPSESEIFDLADFFKLFGDSSRLKILWTLKECKEICVIHLAEFLGMSVSAVSHQLRSLKDAKLIKFRREGKTVYYSLADEHVEEIITVASVHIKELGED